MPPACSLPLASLKLIALYRASRIHNGGECELRLQYHSPPPGIRMPFHVSWLTGLPLDWGFNVVAELKTKKRDENVRPLFTPLLDRPRAPRSARLRYPGLGMDIGKLDAGQLTRWEVGGRIGTDSDALRHLHPGPWCESRGYRARCKAGGWRWVGAADGRGGRNLFRLRPLQSRSITDHDKSQVEIRI
jgi:hypothetical protein